MCEVTIRDLRLEEAELAARFFHEQWRPNHIFWRNRDLLLWQYHDNPYVRRFSNGLTFRAAFKDGVLVGVFGYMPFVFNRYGTKQYGCHLSAWWVHPDQRRGPLALRLLHSLQHQDSFDVCIAGINTPTAERIYSRMSWVVVPNIPRLVLVVDRKQFAGLLDPGQPIPRHALPAVEGKARIAELPAKEPGMAVSNLNSFDSLAEAGWDTFYWEKIAPALMGPARETSYLQWRYGEIPIFHYDAMLATSNGGVTGLLVYRIERVKDRRERVIRLVDLVAEPGTIVPLMSGLIRLGRELRVALIDFFCTYPPYLDQVRSCGFVDASDASGERYWCPHLFQPLDHTRNRLNSSWWIRNTDLKSTATRENFCLMKGDYEFDRPN